MNPDGFDEGRDCYLSYYAAVDELRRRFKPPLGIIAAAPSSLTSG
jgi:hypothetical protein